MAYETGSVNSQADLLTALRTACTDHGWTLSGDVLHKGNAYLKSEIVSGYIRWLGGTGIDGSNNLTGAATYYVQTLGLTSQAFTYPLTWEAHINTDPDEVYFVLSYAVEYYQHVAFGLSDVAALPGTGMWFSASRTTEAAASDYSSQVGGVFLVGGSGAGMSAAAPLFGVYGAQANKTNSFIHHGLDGGGWSTYSTSGVMPDAFRAVAPLLGLLPNTWNGETVLLPFPIYMPRTSGNKISLVADLKHLRHCRIDNHDPGEIITLGGENWKVYPWYRKNTAARDAGNNITHSGTLGYAVRYTGS